jgi:hypothetical protein
LPTLAPLANTRIPSGVVILASKSATGEVHVSSCGSAGSSAQSVPLQASKGKKELKRTPTPDASRFVGVRGSRSVQLIETVTRSPVATRRASTSVVGSGVLVGTAAVPTRTFPTSSRAPTRRCTGMFGQRRKTIRSLARSSANETRDVPRTIVLPAPIESVIAYVGRSAGGDGSPVGAGQPGTAAASAATIPGVNTNTLAILPRSGR